MFDKVRIETLLNRVENAILLIQSKAGQLETPNDFLLDKDCLLYTSDAADE